jgi:hypothetical protein
MRTERARLQDARCKERLIPKAPYFELPAGMMVPLVKPESVTVILKFGDVNLFKFSSSRSTPVNYDCLCRVC